MAACGVSITLTVGSNLRESCKFITNPKWMGCYNTGLFRFEKQINPSSAFTQVIADILLARPSTSELPAAIPMIYKHHDYQNDTNERS